MAARPNEKYETLANPFERDNFSCFYFICAPSPFALSALCVGAPCQLHCKPEGQFFSVMLSDSVVDGTPCNPGTRDMCINGVCRVRMK